MHFSYTSFKDSSHLAHIIFRFKNLNFKEHFKPIYISVYVEEHASSNMGYRHLLALTLHPGNGQEIKILL